MKEIFLLAVIRIVETICIGIGVLIVMAIYNIIENYFKEDEK